MLMLKFHTPIGSSQFRDDPLVLPRRKCVFLPPQSKLKVQKNPSKKNKMHQTERLVIMLHMLQIQLAIHLMHMKATVLRHWIEKSQGDYSTLHCQLYQNRFLVLPTQWFRKWSVQRGNGPHSVQAGYFSMCKQGCQLGGVPSLSCTVAQGRFFAIKALV